MPRGGCHGILKGWEALGPDIEKVALGEGSSLTQLVSVEPQLRPASDVRARFLLCSSSALLAVAHARQLDVGDWRRHFALPLPVYSGAPAAAKTPDRGRDRCVGADRSTPT